MADLHEHPKVEEYQLFFSIPLVSANPRKPPASGIPQKITINEVL
jgi:hypothetical protein